MVIFWENCWGDFPAGCWGGNTGKRPYQISPLKVVAQQSDLQACLGDFRTGCWDGNAGKRPFCLNFHSNTEQGSHPNIPGGQIVGLQQ